MSLYSYNYDFIIVGAGIVGLTVANRLTALYPDASIALLEKEPSLGVHASGRNSGVLHSGIYYGSDTLKASMCTEGAQRMVAFAKENSIACHQLGKIIVATSEQEETSLKKLLENAKKNKIQAFHLNEAEVQKYEPYAKAPFGGVYCPSTAVIDSKAVLNVLYQYLLSKKVVFHFNCSVASIESQSKKIWAGKGQAIYSYGHLFNCAGTSAVQLARYFGLANEYELLPFKGLYYKIKAEKDYIVRSNIYPVPDPALPFLGVHLTRIVSGEVYVGPTVIPAFGQENYGLLSNIRLKELMLVLRCLTMMMVTNQQNFRKLVSSEMKKYLKPYFAKAACKLIHNLSSVDLVSSNKVGIRPQLINMKTKKLEMDFILKSREHSTHVLNAISPAFTSSLAFADLIVENVERA